MLFNIAAELLSLANACGVFQTFIDGKMWSRGVQILDFFKKFMFSKLIWCSGPKKQLLCKKNSKILSLSYRSWKLKKSSIIAPRGIPL